MTRCSKCHWCTFKQNQRQLGTTCSRCWTSIWSAAVPPLERWSHWLLPLLSSCCRLQSCKPHSWLFPDMKTGFVERHEEVTKRRSLGPLWVASHSVSRLSPAVLTVWPLLKISVQETHHSPSRSFLERAYSLFTEELVPVSPIPIFFFVDGFLMLLGLASPLSGVSSTTISES